MELVYPAANMAIAKRMMEQNITLFIPNLFNRIPPIICENGPMAPVIVNVIASAVAVHPNSCMRGVVNTLHAYV